MNPRILKHFQKRFTLPITCSALNRLMPVFSRWEPGLKPHWQCTGSKVTLFYRFLYLDPLPLLHKTNLISPKFWSQDKIWFCIALSSEVFVHHDATLKLLTAFIRCCFKEITLRQYEVKYSDEGTNGDWSSNYIASKPLKVNGSSLIAPPGNTLLTSVSTINFITFNSQLILKTSCFWIEENKLELNIFNLNHWKIQNKLDMFCPEKIMFKDTTLNSKSKYTLWVLASKYSKPRSCRTHGRAWGPALWSSTPNKTDFAKKFEVVPKFWSKARRHAVYQTVT